MGPDSFERFILHNFFKFRILQIAFDFLYNKGKKLCSPHSICFVLWVGALDSRIMNRKRITFPIEADGHRPDSTPGILWFLTGSFEIKCANWLLFMDFFHERTKCCKISNQVYRFADIQRFNYVAIRNVL